MVHQRSPEAMERRNKKRKRSDRIDPLTPHGVLLNQSWKDWVTGEIVHTKETEDVVYETIKILFGDGYKLVCAELEYGQVLNRSPPTVISVTERWC